MMRHPLRSWLLFPLGVLLLLLPARAPAETVRLLVSIGANVGAPEDPVLSFADDDAERVRRLFIELGGVRTDRAYLLVDPTATVVRQRLAEVAGRIAELRSSGNDVVLVVYVSSHARAGVLHLAGTGLPLAELRDTTRQIGARLAVVIVDACESGTLAQRKGGSAAPAYDVSLERLPLRGQVIISSSGPGESSEEWDSLKGSLFTHHLLTGLRGDADAEGDGKVSLSEAYAYAYRRTVAGSSSAGQHPAYAWDLSGTGELILTEPDVARSALVFPSAASGRFVVASQPRSDVVAEVDKQSGRPLRLAVPPGRYLVRKRAGESTGLLEVELPYGGERRVQEEKLVWRRFTEVALKGGYVALRNSALLGLARLESAPVRGSGLRLAGGLGYRHTWGSWWALGTLTATGASYRGVALDITERALGLGVSAGYRWMEWALVPHLGLSVELTGMRQSLHRDAEDEIQDNFGAAPLAPRQALGVAVGPVVGVEIPLWGHSFALVQGQLLLRYLPSEQQPSVRPGGLVSAGAGWRF
ncbi:caspase family protein [Vitiosangium sp. GDMCC 1.1324]|uniref:caspase family protein n=1 Tax=Vitiosangium sp. (strain GDMCC 1.1324) TaxID=2138576 RepID=UPI000D3D6E85|nr:caspase family protein [Vitiosangium sp. GDMCC 1.1324]